MSALCSPDEENKAQARFVAKLKHFATKFGVHVVLVNKMATQYREVLLKHCEPVNAGCAL